MPTVAIDARDARRSGERGSDSYTRELVGALRRRGAGDGVTLRFLERGWPGPELLWEQVALPAILGRMGADAVHAPNWPFPLRRPCPGVVTIHDLAFEAHPDDYPRRTALKARAIAPRAARSADRVICVSRFTAEDVCLRYGVDRERTRVIPLAPALPEGDQEPPAPPYLLAAGDLRPRKNLTRLVEAFRILHRDGLPHRLVLAGIDSGEGERLRAASAGLPVEMTGYLPDERLDAVMRGADALVFPSLYEGFGLVMVEAMARGRPVAAASATALPEVGGDAALYFDPLDVDDMAAALRRLVDDRALRERLGESGRKRAAELSWDATADRTAAVYRELLP